MQSGTSLKLSNTIFFVLFIAGAAALASNTGQTFESDFVKALKEKFRNFFGKTHQDRLYVQTDKPFYKPGETVWFTAYARNAENMLPSDNSDVIHVELITPKGTTEKHYKIVTKNGAAQGDFDLSGHPGGIYKIRAYTQWQKNDTSALVFEKEITVQNVVMPRLKMKMDFEKKAYGKGDEVIAKLELNTNSNTPLANTKVKFKATLDGKELVTNTATTDGAGKVELKFKLPADLNSVDGLVNALIDYEGSTESISRSVPIVLNKIKLEFFAEGGDMVQNMPGRVAFRATNEFEKPADVEGTIVDSKGAFVTSFSSYHFGMGMVDLTPKAGEHYRARITKPVGILDEFELPEVLQIGYTLKVNETGEQNLKLNVASWQAEQLTVAVQVRGNLCYTGAFNATKGNNELLINTAAFPIGVAQITLFDSKGIARAERLAFVNKNKQLKISVSTDKQQYKPREKVNMNVQVTDEKGLPMPGTFSLAVVDDNLLSFADDKQGNILSKMLLEPELKEKVEEPAFYFDAKEPKANKALDLLLMTSGWRKYTWKQITDGDLPVISYLPEKAILSGTVYDGYTSKPIAGALLKFKDSGRSTVTDNNGKFTFTKFDIARSNQIEITAANKQKQEQTISNYGTDNTYYLYGRYPVTYNFNAGVAKGAAMAVDEIAEAPMARRDLKAPLAKHKNNAEREAIYFVDVADANAAVAPDLADDIEIKKEEKPAAETGAFEQGRVGYAAFDTIMMFDKNVERAENEVVFYRAKEFAAKKHNAIDTIRNDFSSTVYWNGSVVTDRSGRAKVQFTTNDLISSFKTTIEGFGDDGSIGRAEYNYSTSLPFAMDVKLPVELVSGDKIMVPVFLKNTTNEAISGKLDVSVPTFIALGNKVGDVTIPAGETKVIYLECTANATPGQGDVAIRFGSPKYNDAFTRPVKVVSKGFPVSIGLSGQEMQKEFAINLVNVVPGSIKVDFNAYPNVMSELMSGVESILREPYGCFEQTSSSNYPNIMVLQYLKNMQLKDPVVEARARKLLDDGYKKLVAFETKENGYEWFGASPAHEALTAYGLMEFQDMKQVYNGVDDKMIDRTVNLLLSKRDGNGGFKKNPRALDSFGAADEDVTNAYIVYALSEAGYKNIGKELDAVYKSAIKSNDPYIMALVANALQNVGDKTRGDEMVNRLINARNEAGFWTGKKHSITRSTGEGLKVETTSLILLALMKATNPDVAAITSAVKFLVGARSGYGGFGSTQATILALKALTKYAEFSKKTDEAGTVEVLVNGAVAGTKEYAKGEKANITIPGIEKFVTPGAQKIEVRFKGCKQGLPYALNVAYSTTLPENAKQCVVSLETKISAKQVKVGETLHLSATLKNKTAEGQPMTMAVIGIPAGFSMQPWQLKEMMDKGTIDFYEIVGNNVACYYRALAPNAQKQINFDLKAEIPGQYDAPASAAYLYYTAENKNWAGLERVFINP